MRLIIIESPYAGDRERNTLYALACVRDAIIRGESPFASHLLYPGALNDDDAGERDIGIRCGFAWWRAASCVAFYTDLGWSPGMLRAYKRVRTQNLKWEERSIANNQNTGPRPKVALL